MATCAQPPTSFASQADEITFWKSEATRYREITEEVQQELQEFRECSEEFERELEMQLEQNEKQVKELKQQNTSLTFECETLKERYEKLQAEHFKQVTHLQKEVDKLTVANSELVKDVRELEQRNDDLERTNRVIIVSLDDFEQRLNQALERNAFLESELDEKDSLAITVQRLRDEARDLHHELSVRQHKPVERTKSQDGEGHSVEAMNAKNTDEVIMPPPKTPSTPNGKKTFANGIHPICTPTKLQLPETPKMKGNVPNGVDKTQLTPSARISALNIVGDLLRKVGALESKLASCRNFVHEQPGWHGKRSTGPPKATESSTPSKLEQANGRTQTMKIRV
ncbi:nuclear distribution protein nudE homolog 1-like [Clavelina lepadiformis]|uniref:nuclear distribution protein nudE homolog 1-like n=1 Tax=Clavelina lepadiformis TaxID=159417 RepID=UPI00404129EA